MQHVRYRVVLVAYAAGLALAGCASPAYKQLAPAPSTSTPPPAPVHASLPAAPHSYLGVYETDLPRSYQLVDQFTRAIGRRPNLVLAYSGWGAGFNSAFAATARAHGATVIFDLDPTNVSVGQIADGTEDVFLNSYATQVRAFGHPVVISFAHEMNGDWYQWGWTHTPPQLWVEAWRRIVNVFHQAGAYNVTWLWTVNYATTGEGPIQDWWPGSKYVTWVGVDAYYDIPTERFNSQFLPTVTAIRKFTHRPILIGETAVGPLAGQATGIPDLFAGIRNYHLLGLVYFDVTQHGSVFKQDWRLEGKPAVLATFRQAVRIYLSPAR
jgi:mannan endo-1,4-beta-mannosidase